MRRQLAILGASVLALFYSGVAHAQDVLSCGELIHPAAGPASAPTVTPGTNLISVGEAVYFISGDDTGSGIDPKYLWRTDGTPTGTFTVTTTVADFSPLYLFTALNDQLILRATTPDTGAELWVTDGTPQGTQLLRDITPGATDTTHHSSWLALGDRLFFAVYAEGETTWWSTAGTAATTAPLPDLAAGDQPNGYFFAQSATEAYLASFVSGKDVMLWRFDGQNFHLVKEFIGDNESSDLTGIGQGLMQNGKLYFFARVAGGASGLWRSDGTDVGTELLFAGDFVSPTDQSVASGVHPFHLVATNDHTIFFFEYDQPLLRLWRLDSTLGTTTLVKTIRMRSEDDLYYPLQFESALAYDQTLYFSFWWRDNRLQWSQTEIWTSDGTEAGTHFFTGLPMGGAFSFGTPNGLFLTTSLGVTGTYVLEIPWVQAFPTIVCNLGSHFYAYPKLFLHNRDIYVSGRNAWLGAEHLWRLDPTTLRPTNVFLPGIAR